MTEYTYEDVKRRILHIAYANGREIAVKALEVYGVKRVIDLPQHMYAEFCMAVDRAFGTPEWNQAVAAINGKYVARGIPEEKQEAQAKAAKAIADMADEEVMQILRDEKKREPLTWAKPSKFDPWNGFVVKRGGMTPWGSAPEACQPRALWTHEIEG